MKTLKQLERLRKAHKLIRYENTGTPKEFALKLHISEREIYRILEYLREVDAIICFSRTANSYYYIDEFDLLVNVSVKVLIKEEIRTIYAGTTILDKKFESSLLINTTDRLWQ